MFEARSGEVANSSTSKARGRREPRSKVVTIGGDGSSLGRERGDGTNMRDRETATRGKARRAEDRG